MKYSSSIALYVVVEFFPILNWIDRREKKTWVQCDMYMWLSLIIERILHKNLWAIHAVSHIIDIHMAHFSLHNKKPLKNAKQREKFINYNIKHKISTYIHSSDACNNINWHVVVKCTFIKFIYWEINFPSPENEFHA